MFVTGPISRILYAVTRVTTIYLGCLLPDTSSGAPTSGHGLAQG